MSFPLAVPVQNRGGGASASLLSFSDAVIDARRCELKDARMSKIVSILRATHCRSTHHYFAIDALKLVNTAQGQRLAQMLLKYHDEYLVGAKAPDKSFRDFQNHVLHVGDNFWGGAPKACEKWLKTTIDHLDKKQWKKAAFACGVLSHYFTDPIMPLHTGQTDREAAVHRPMEWSVCKSYDAIYQLIDRDKMQVDFPLLSGDRWIYQAVISAATVAHAHYERLVDIYDLDRGAKNPPEGLNQESRQSLAELFAIATRGWANILSRIADETSAEIPKVSLSLTTLLATIDMPLAWIVRRISDIGEQRAVAKIFEEFRRTGTVQKNLPNEIKVVKREIERSASRRLVQPSAESSVGVPVASSVNAGSQSRGAAVDSSSALSDKLGSEKGPQIDRQFNLRAPLPTPAGEKTAPLSSGDKVHADKAARQLEPLVSQAGRTSDREVARAQPGLSMSANLVDAPSIGPKTARRFDKIGIVTVAQFLSADIAAMREQLATRWITDSLLQDWKDQARLVCSVPGLCGYKAQLLVECNCRTSQQLSESNAVELHGRLEAVSRTTEGKRILRSSKLPTVDDVASWIESALVQLKDRNIAA